MSTVSKITGLTLFMVLMAQTFATFPNSQVACPVNSLKDSIFAAHDTCPINAHNADEIEMVVMDITSVGATELVFSIIACIASFALFVIHPLPIIYKLWRNERVEDSLLYPFVACCFHNVAWVLYIYYVSPGRYDFYTQCHFFSTAIALLIEMAYCMVMMALSSEVSKQILLQLTCLVLAALYFILLSVSFVGYVRGVIGIVFGLFMYASPVCIMHSDSTRLLCWFGCSLLTGFSWCILSFLISTFDPYIAVTNGFGVIIQLDLTYKHMSATRPEVVERVRSFINGVRGLKLYKIFTLVGYVVLFVGAVCAVLVEIYSMYVLYTIGYHR